MIKGRSQKRAALKEHEDGRVTTCSGRLFHKRQADIKKDFWKETVWAKGIQYKQNEGDEFKSWDE